MTFKWIWRSPFILLVLTTFFWGGNAVVGRILADVMGPVTISFLRTLISAVIFVPFAYSVMKKEAKEAISNIGLLIILSLTGVIGYNLLGYWALNYTTAVHVTLINSSSPIFITILSLLTIKERVSKPLIVSVVFSVTGVLWVMTQGSLVNIFNFQYNIGDVIMVGAVLSWSIYSILLKVIIDRLSSFSIFGYSLVIALPLIFIGTLVELKYVPIMSFGGLDVLSLLYLGIFPSIFAFLMWNRAILLVGPSSASIFINLTPIFGGLLAYLTLGEQLTVSHLIGGILVFTGVIIVSRKGQERIIDEKGSKLKNTI